MFDPGQTKPYVPEVSTSIHISVCLFSRSLLLLSSEVNNGEIPNLRANHMQPSEAADQDTLLISNVDSCLSVYTGLEVEADFIGKVP